MGATWEVILKIMIVDDSKYMRMVIRDVVESVGHTVVTEAEDGETAVEKYQLFMPDLVFMDITMPIMSGFDALKNIRALDRNAKVIMCSAMGQQWLIRDAIMEGAIDFITKPFKSEKIIFILERIEQRLLSNR